MQVCLQANKFMVDKAEGGIPQANKFMVDKAEGGIPLAQFVDCM